MPAPDDGFIKRFVSLAELEGERVFARFEHEVISFGHLHERSNRIAAGLRRLGVRPGDRVSVMLSNSPTALALLFALAKSRAIWVPLNVQLRAEGLRYILDHAEPRIVIARADLIPVVQACGAQLPQATLVAEGEVEGVLPFTSLTAGTNNFDEELPGPESLFAISYTSGTTGPPKGVLMSHRMLRLAGEGARLVSDARDDDVLFVWEPLYHIGGSQLIVVPLLRRVILHMAPRFSASRFWAEVSAAGATHIHFLGGILQILLKQPRSHSDRTHGVRIAWGGGCPPEVWRAVEERFGVQVRECYGMTEASSFTTYNDRGVVGSVGRPVPWFAVELVGKNGASIAAGERGEIVVRSEDPLAITQGYFRNPEATARSLRRGSLYTGDVGSRDSEGNLYFHGRSSDSVRVKGENVSAWEVESVAAAHPAVEDCAMIGVAADVGEQDIKLFVKLRSASSLEPASLTAWLAERLAPFQIPRYVSIVDEFERTPSQRIMKHRLSTSLEHCWDRLAHGDAMLPPPPAGQPSGRA